MRISDWSSDVCSSDLVNKKKIEEVARATVKKIGYEQAGFHWKTAKVEILLHGQSADIAVGVDAAGNKDEGAGDQGLMFGYAVADPPELLPAPTPLPPHILTHLADAPPRRAAQTRVGTGVVKT